MGERTAPRPRKVPEADTKTRIMDAAEVLFLAHGGDAMSLRGVTGLAGVNIAAVNYHFGGKEKLVHAVLERRLDPLNAARMRLLDACDARWKGPSLTCEHVLAALFVPAIGQARAAGSSGFSRMRFMGRAYSDSSPVTVAFMKERYDATSARFLDAFARAIPALPRADLKLRLSFVLKSVAGLIAGADLPELVAAFDRGETRVGGSDSELLASLGSLMAGALMAPSRASDRDRAFTEVFALSRGGPIFGVVGREGDQERITTQDGATTPGRSVRAVRRGVVAPDCLTPFENIDAAE